MRADPDGVHLHERALVADAQQGDPDAWEVLYRASYPRLRAYALRRSGATVSDDIVAETWSRAVQGIDRYRWTGVGFDAWLFGIARRVMADHYPQAGKVRLIRAHRAAEPSPEGPGDGLEVDEDRAALRRTFARLPEADREILELRVVAGLSAAQTASLLGRRPGAIRTAQHRALCRLRQLLGDEVGAEEVG